MVRSAGDKDACCGAESDMVRAGEAAAGAFDGSGACDEMATSEESRVELVAAAAALELHDAEGVAEAAEATAGDETPAAAAIADTRSRNVTVACAMDEGMDDDGDGAATDETRDDAAGNGEEKPWPSVMDDSVSISNGDCECDGSEKNFARRE